MTPTELSKLGATIIETEKILFESRKKLQKYSDAFAIAFAAMFLKSLNYVDGKYTPPINVLSAAVARNSCRLVDDGGEYYRVEYDNSRGYTSTVETSYCIKKSYLDRIFEIFEKDIDAAITYAFNECNKDDDIRSEVAGLSSKIASLRKESDEIADTIETLKRQELLTDELKKSLATKKKQLLDKITKIKEDAAFKHGYSIFRVALFNDNNMRGEVLLPNGCRHRFNTNGY